MDNTLAIYDDKIVKTWNLYHTNWTWSSCKLQYCA